MNAILALTLLTALTALTACGADHDHPHPPGPTPGAPAPAGDDHHGAAHPLGKLTVGSYTFDVTLFGEVGHDGEVALRLAVAAGEALPTTARAWLGIAGGEGSRKAPLAKDGPDALHAHVEVPEPRPDGSKLWVEIEANGGLNAGAIALP